jgi:hypothetical protein
MMPPYRSTRPMRGCRSGTALAGLRLDASAFRPSESSNRAEEWNSRAGIQKSPASAWSPSLSSRVRR